MSSFQVNQIPSSITYKILGQNYLRKSVSPSCFKNLECLTFRIDFSWEDMNDYGNSDLDTNIPGVFERF